MDKIHDIFIIEDHPAVQEGLISYFEKSCGWRVTGTASGLENAKEKLTQTAADILLLDIELEDGLGLNLIPWLKQQVSEKKASALPVIAVYTAYDDFVHVSAALSKDVQVYMCKRRSLSELEQALLKALNGEKYIDDTVQMRLEYITDVTSALTKREKEIFSLVKSGLSNKKIAVYLGINVRTVENILSCIYDKTGVHSRTELLEL